MGEKARHGGMRGGVGGHFSVQICSVLAFGDYDYNKAHFARPASWFADYGHSLDFNVDQTRVPDE